MRASTAVVLGFAALTSTSLLSGCRTDPGLWAMNYKDLGNYPSLPSDPDAIEFERVMSVDELKHLPQQEGLIIIGMTRFTTAPVLEPDEGGAPDPKLREFAAAAGADVVRWAGRTIEFGRGNFEDRQEYLAVFYTHEWAQSVGLTFRNPEPGSWVPENSSVLATGQPQETAEEPSGDKAIATEPVDLDG